MCNIGVPDEDGHDLMQALGVCELVFDWCVTIGDGESEQHLEAVEPQQLQLFLDTERGVQVEQVEVLTELTTVFVHLANSLI